MVLLAAPIRIQVPFHFEVSPGFGVGLNHSL